MPPPDSNDNAGAPASDRAGGTRPHPAGPAGAEPTAADHAHPPPVALPPTADRPPSPDRTPARRLGRAGRNLPAAFAVGGSLGALVLATLLLWRPAFLAVIVAGLAVAVLELVRAVRAVGVYPPLPPLLAGAVALPAAAWLWGTGGLALALLGTVVTAMLWRLWGGPTGFLRDASAAALVGVYPVFVAGFVALLAAAEDGHWRVLAMLGVVVLSDTGGYVAGIFLGRRLLAPSISPKKSWEGLGGSLVAAAAGGAIGLPLIFQVDWWWGAVFGLVVAVAAVLGDLVESLLKRDLGRKDMSGLLPGHGGLLDRVDSILLAAPTAYLLLTVLVR